MSRGPLVLGGLGHSLFRLSRARATSRGVGFDIKEVLYPGFEGRPPAASLDNFFEQVELQVDVYRLSHKKPLVYATGFGALVLLGLRARGRVRDLPSVIQGAVPWHWALRETGGDPARGEAARVSLTEPAQQEAFVVEHLHSPFDAEERKAVFGGFVTCTAMPDLYGWFDAGWLAWLEGTLAARPTAIDDISVWLGGEDTLIDEDEHDAAVRALGANWPLERAQSWGHFPYLDAPGPWVAALRAMGV
ncbi:MAG: hypothetical protein AAGG01_03495 [Planctomycetota bacterium]